MNTFLPRSRRAPSPAREVQLSRASTRRRTPHRAPATSSTARHAGEAPAALRALQEAAPPAATSSRALMDAVEHCTLGQITHALYEVGGEYRRNI